VGLSVLRLRLGVTMAGKPAAGQHWTGSGEVAEAPARFPDRVHCSG